MTSLNLTKYTIIAFSLIMCIRYVTSQKHICGPALDSVLDIICENGFNIKFKKSMEWHENAGSEEKLPFQTGSFPFLAKIHGGQVDTLTKTRHRREGVYDECCLKACTYSELFSYCN